MTTPIWQAPVNGPQSQLDSVDSAGHLNQFFGAHPLSALGTGIPVVRPTTGTQSIFQHINGSPGLPSADFAQAFTMSGTTIGRVTLPIYAFGNGADLMVTLCPDNSGNPNLFSPIAQVKVPASVIVATGAQTGLENADTVFQTPWNNTQFGSNFAQTIPWVSPAATANGAPSYFSVVTSGNYSLLLGGFDTTASTASALCFTVQYTGAGNINAPIPQPPLPQATFQAYAAATPDTVVLAGGTTTSSSVTNVWSASWDSSTGVIGAWSSQTALPVALTNGSAASWGEYVYIVGGNTANTIASSVNTVYVNSVSNSQLGNWTTSTPLPVALSLPFVGVVGNWIVVAGGVDTTNTCRSETYYAPISSDGSLGAWRNGPSLFQAVDAAIAGWCFGVTDSSIIIYAGSTTGGGLGSYVQQLSVGPSGVANAWNVMRTNNGGFRASSAFTDGNGVWYLMCYNINNTAEQNLFLATPTLSVPLYASGLSNGTQYWIVLQEIKAVSDSDYLGLGVSVNAYSVDAKQSPRNQNSWSTYFSNYSVPLTIYDDSFPQAHYHLVEDLSTANTNSALYQRWLTVTYGQNNLLSGVIEVSMQPNLALNSNPTFNTTTSPWTATGGTLTRSNAHTQGGFSFSGLLTPTGGVQAYASTELVPVKQTTFGSEQWILGTGWFYSTTGYATFTLNLNWFDSGQNYISTTFNTVALSANTWTQVSTYGQVPATAAFFTVSPTEPGTPTNSNLLYISNCYGILSPETVGTSTSIATVDYASGTLWPTVGVTQSN